ncbi:hypothetical protein AGMMS49983_09360 [Clostridia bacterium]|nr:hypothetical protein AGMMS49983_09360 [Clostridia bacterium]
MKFANYIFKGKGYNNLGDNMQLIAIDNLYERMNVPLDEIVYINKNNLSSYDGEDVVLPVTMPLVDYVPNGLAGRFSPKIRPVFLGLTMVRDFLYKEEVEYVKRFEPIGCRDERTLQTVRNAGVNAYLNGCITATLPERTQIVTPKGKVFLVDIPEAVEQYIPQDLLERAERVTHNRFGETEDPKRMMAELYDRYKNEAALVVTSLLHCSVPCLSAGIPVILAKTVCSYRFGWLEKLLPIYTKEQFDQIEWVPEKVEYSVHKLNLIENTIAQILSSQDRFETAEKVHDFYLNRVRKAYVVDAFMSLQLFLENNWNYDESYKYGVWGLTQTSEYLDEYVSRNYPKATFSYLFDRNESIEYKGLKALSPDHIVDYPDIYIFVTTPAARNDAISYFREIGRSQKMYATVDLMI